MIYEAKLAKWFGLTGLMMMMAGCPGGDDGDTGAETGPAPTSGVATDATPSTGEPPPATTTGEESTGTPDPDTTTGAATCDPPCEAGQECIGGTCFDMPGDSSSGEPPAECGLVVQLQFPNAECGPCLEDACCPQLQGCFGDETTMMETECLTLNNCIAMSCPMAMSLQEVQTCVDENCTEVAGAFNDWIAYQSCLGMNCVASCS